VPAGRSADERRIDAQASSDSCSRRICTRAVTRAAFVQELEDGGKRAGPGKIA
jgi:hypothetical protein